MKLKDALFTCVCLFLFCFFTANTSVVTASVKDKPDSIEIIEQNLDELVDETVIDRNYYAECSEIWDFSKDFKVTYGNLEYLAYLSKDGTKFWIHEISQVKPSKLSNLEFPDQINGIPVTKLGASTHILVFADSVCNIFGYSCEPYHDYELSTEYYIREEDASCVLSDQITSVTIPSTVTELENYCFHNLHNLKKIVLPDGITQIESYMFYYCVNLQEIVLPANLKEFNRTAFRKCKSLSAVKLSKSNPSYTFKNGMLLSKDEKTIIWVVPNIKKLSIPKGITTIDSYATTYSYVTDITIPMSLTQINNQAFNGDFIKNITVASTNPRYKKTGNCIYSTKTHRLVVAISSSDSFTLPKEVYYLKNNLSVAGKPIYTLTLSTSFKKLYNEWYSNDKLDNPNLVFQSKKPPLAESNSIPWFSTFYVPKGCVSIYQKWYDATIDKENDYLNPDTEILEITKRK